MLGRWSPLKFMLSRIITSKWTGQSCQRPTKSICGQLKFLLRRLLIVIIQSFLEQLVAYVLMLWKNACVAFPEPFAAKPVRLDDIEKRAQYDATIEWHLSGA